jgi:LmbE family N-acetylglucosaminyl deacetylase
MDQKKQSQSVKGKFLKRLDSLSQNRRFMAAYAVVCVGILLLTTVFWALLGGRVQDNNADQLSDSYLFESADTFKQALFPGDHTFLIKWPVFWLIKLFDYSSVAFIVATIVLSLLTVMFLAFVMYRIDRRPLIFGTLCLALASILLMIPAQPHAGGLLPVNMAMTTTRNLEYALFIGFLVLIARAHRYKSWQFGVALAGMILLVASDKLFLTLALGGSLLSLIVYATVARWNVVSLATRWFFGTAIAGIGGTILLWLINASHVTNIVSSSRASTYAIAQQVHDLALGALYGVLGIFTNFGANPAYDATEVAQIPRRVADNLWGSGGFAYVINALLLLAGIYAAGRVIQMSLNKHKTKSRTEKLSVRLTIMLVAASLTAIAAFVATQHYYAVDARYLTIALFAIVVAATTYTSQQRQPVGHTWLLLGGLMLVSITSGIFGAHAVYATQRHAQLSLKERNALITEAISHHKTDILVGDYWRVLPIEQQSDETAKIMPLESCTKARQALTSKAWDANLDKQSFTYLLTLDGSPADFPNCSFEEIVKAYGRPNESTLIAGTLSNPQELLLFYDKGINKTPATSSTRAVPSTILPINLDELTNTSCQGPTVMNIVAHQDDDLLFMSPDLLHSVQAQQCIRTVYITAGDAGSNQLYWLSRELGSKAAYSSMLGTEDVWVQRVVKLPGGQYAEIANPRGNTRISLIFLHMPDGNMHGEGFSHSHDASIAKLFRGQIKNIQTVDSQSTYTANQVRQTLSQLMHVYQPAEIRTQSSQGGGVPDHSDHATVGRFAKQAYDQYETVQFDNKVVIPMTYYVGYSTQSRPANVFGPDAAAKQAAMMAFGGHDQAVCASGSGQTCKLAPVYDAYIQRQYTAPN